MVKLIVSRKKKRWLPCCHMACANVDKSAVASKRFLCVYEYIYVRVKITLWQFINQLEIPGLQQR